MSGESASSAPSPNSAVTTTATAVSRPIAGMRPASAIATRRDEQAGGAAEQQRHAGERGDTSPGSSAWASDSAL